MYLGHFVVKNSGLPDFNRVKGLISGAGGGIIFGESG